MLSVDNAPLSLGSTQEDEVNFAHRIADRLAGDIMMRYGFMARMFKPNKLELYVLNGNSHISDDDLFRSECKYSRVHLPQDEAKRELMRQIMCECLSNVIQARKLPFRHSAVEICGVPAYTYADRDRYGMDYALRITLTK